MKNIRTPHANFNGFRHLTVLTLLIINLLYSFCTANASEPAFSRLTMADGLSHYSVMARIRMSGACYGSVREEDLMYTTVPTSGITGKFPATNFRP